MWGTPSVLMALVPTVVAGKPLISTGPSGGVPLTIAMATLITCPTSSPAGSNTMPTNGFGIGVGTGAGIGTISKWMSTPSTMSMNVLASIAPPGRPLVAGLMGETLVHIGEPEKFEPSTMAGRREGSALAFRKGGTTEMTASGFPTRGRAHPSSKEGAF